MLFIEIRHSPIYKPMARSSMGAISTMAFAIISPVLDLKNDPKEIKVATVANIVHGKYIITPYDI